MLSQGLAGDWATYVDQATLMSDDDVKTRMRKDAVAGLKVGVKEVGGSLAVVSAGSWRLQNGDVP